MFRLGIVFVATALAMAGCSAPAPQPAEPLPRILPISSTMEFLARPYAEAQPAPGDGLPRFCHVSLDCMELDSRPFSPCLVDGAKCEGEGGFIRTSPPDIIPAVDMPAFPDPPPGK